MDETEPRLSLEELDPEELENLRIRADAYFAITPYAQWNMGDFGNRAVRVKLKTAAFRQEWKRRLKDIANDANACSGLRKFTLEEIVRAKALLRGAPAPVQNTESPSVTINAETFNATTANFGDQSVINNGGSVSHGKRPRNIQDEAVNAPCEPQACDTTDPITIHAHTINAATLNFGARSVLNGPSVLNVKRRRRNLVEESDIEVTESTPVATSVPTSVNPSNNKTPITSLAEHLVLPSGANLQRCLEETYGNSPDLQADLTVGFLFLEHSEFRKTFAEEDLAYLKRLFPKIPTLPDVFDACYATLEPYICTRGVGEMLVCAPPEGLRQQDRPLWTYILSATLHFVENYSVLEKRSPSHGEVWSDVNIWAPLVDAVFLRSQTLTLDRKELQSIVIVPSIDSKKPSKDAKYDGIMRSSGTSQSRIDLGFIEVKPDRLPYPVKDDSDRAKDRAKVIRALKGTLSTMAAQVDRQCMSRVVVIGILCNGLHMTILRAANPSPGLFLLKETSLEVSLELQRFRNLLEVCWRIKLALEFTHQAVHCVLAPVKLDFD